MIKVTVTIEMRADEFEEIFVPGDAATEFRMKTYDAFVEALHRLTEKQIDPHGVFSNHAAAKTKK